MSFAIMRLSKQAKGGAKVSQRHNEREGENHSNIDIDPEKKDLNYSLVDCPDYEKKVDELIKSYYTGQKAIRSDAVKSVEFVFTSDEKLFAGLSPQKEKEYFEKSLDFLKEKFGEKNIVAAIVHKDEKTPHLHAIITPITSDGRLSFKAFVDGKKDLSKLQDSYYEHMKKDFDVERGKSSIETKRQHEELQQFKKKTSYHKELENVRKPLELLKEATSKEHKSIKSRAESLIYTGLEKSFIVSESTIQELVAIATQKETDKKEQSRLKSKINVVIDDNTSLKDINNKLSEQNKSLNIEVQKKEKTLKTVETFINKPEVKEHWQKFKEERAVKQKIISKDTGRDR